MKKKLLALALLAGPTVALARPGLPGPPAILRLTLRLEAPGQGDKTPEAAGRAAEPVKAVPPAGRQAKPERVDDATPAGARSARGPRSARSPRGLESHGASRGRGVGAGHGRGHQ